MSRAHSPRALVAVAIAVAAAGVGCRLSAQEEVVRETIARAEKAHAAAQHEDTALLLRAAGDLARINAGRSASTGSGSAG